MNSNLKAWLKGVLQGAIGNALWAAALAPAIPTWLRSLNDLEAGIAYTLAAIFLPGVLVISVRRFRRQRVLNTNSEPLKPKEVKPDIENDRFGNRVSPHWQEIPSLPPGFQIRSQELRVRTDKLAPHILYTELEIEPSISGHFVYFHCNGPLYREQCHFGQDGVEVGSVEAGPNVNSVALRVGGRGFASPGLLIAELASIASFRILHVETKPYFGTSTTPGARGETLLRAELDKAALEVEFVIDSEVTYKTPSIAAAGEVPVTVGFLVVHNAGASAVKCRAFISVNSGIPDWPSHPVLGQWHGHASSLIEIDSGHSCKVVIAVLLMGAWNYRWSVPYWLDGKTFDAKTPSFFRSNTAKNRAQAHISVTIKPESHTVGVLPVCSVNVQGAEIKVESTVNRQL